MKYQLLYGHDSEEFYRIGAIIAGETRYTYRLSVAGIMGIIEAVSRNGIHFMHWNGEALHDELIIAEADSLDDLIKKVPYIFL